MLCITDAIHIIPVVLMYVTRKAIRLGIFQPPPVQLELDGLEKIQRHNIFQIYHSIC